MKNALLYTSISILMTLFGSCGSNKNLQDTPPSKITESYFYETEGGKRLSFMVAEIPADVHFEAVFFHGLKSKLVSDPNEQNMFHADFDTKMTNVVMHEDPKKEYGNKLPQKPERSPVEISQTEALIVYTKDGDQKFYKLTGIVEKE